MRRFACAWLLLVGLLGASVVRGDGGSLVLREERDSLIVALFAAPTPLRVGAATFDVLVQSRATGEPLPSADVRLRLLGPDTGEARDLDTRSDLGGNRLYRSVRVSLSSPGPWQIEVLASDREGRQEVFRAQLEVAPPRSPALEYWLPIAATPLGLLVLGLHQALCLSRLSARSRETRRASPSTPRGRPSGP